MADVLSSIIKFDLHIYSKASEYKENAGIVDHAEVYRRVSYDSRWDHLDFTMSCDSCLILSISYYEVAWGNLIKADS